MYEIVNILNYPLYVPVCELFNDQNYIIYDEFELSIIKSAYTFPCIINKFNSHGNKLK